MSRYDPRGKVNRALLVGVSEYDHTAPDTQGVNGQLPAVRRNRMLLEDALHQGNVFGAGEVRALASPTPDEFTGALRRACRKARGLLLLYFAGHAVTSTSGSELHLQMRTARVLTGDELPGSVSFSQVLGELVESRAEQVVVILDCCYAGNAAGIWHRFDDPKRKKDKILLLMSVQPNRCILGGDADVPTPFTRELAHVLDEGGEVWLSKLYSTVKQRMAEAKYKLEDNDTQRPQALAPPWDSDADVLLAAGPVITPFPDDPPIPRWRLWLRSTFARARKAVGRLGRTGLTVLLAVLVTGAGGYGVLVLAGGSGHCGPARELRLLTDPDLEPAMRAAADAYAASDANTTDDGCRRSGVTVYSAGAAGVVTALGKRTDAWQQPRDDDNPQRDIGPQPDVWIPAARADVRRVTAAQEDRVFARLEPDAEPFVYSPVVLAVPEGLDDAVEPTGRTLSQLVTGLEQELGEAEVHRPDPEFADSALLATVGLYGRGADARGAERLITQSGRPEPSAVRLLCTLADVGAVDDRSAALVPEFLLKSGVGCHPATRAPRTAAYPDDVPGLEPTFVRVRWEDGERDADARDAEVDRFRSWLTGDEGRGVLGEQGFRSAHGERRLLDAKSAPEGLIDEVRPAGSADPSEMDTALESYGNAHGPGRVLFLLDSSGSMAGLWDGSSGGPGIIEQTLTGLGGEDEYGVWAVHGLGGRTHTDLLPFGTHSRREAERALDAARVRDAEADPSAVLPEALEFMRERGTGDERPQLIVYLTDGEDDNRLTGGELKQVVDRARTAGVPLAMVTLKNGACDRDRPGTQIAQAGRGRCLDAGDDLVPTLRDEVARTGTGEE
ncbi:substrate-binding domain-containing protein [Streptomyces coeruleorubidus]|uniref:vWA domain-containing protein n=1 Tax=Streptomyces coeruleorubidus TaxID=116188 RepID=UPI00237F5E69|nr:caspase family protein [Streptomyces coeruleorubidus]WDV53112.1 substrate-binding domain-containing protein [Streptomyces coeruleorubidus]